MSARLALFFRVARVAVLVPALAAATACLEIPTDLETPQGQAAAPASAQELLDRYIAASGGAEALRALSQRTLEARVTFKAQEGCEENAQNCIWEDTSGQLVLYSTADGRMYRRMVIGDNVIESGFDGETGWQLQAEPQMLVLEDPEVTPVLREDALLHWYFDVDKRPGLSLELLPSRKVQTEEGERELDGIRWFAPGPASPDMEKWFDRSTGLLFEEVERDAETGDLVRRIHSDYREVDGVMVPFAMKQVTVIEGLPEQVVELHMQVVHHRAIRDETFAVPELGTAEPEPDVLLANLEQARTDAKVDPKDPAAQLRVARAAFQTAHFAEAKEAAKAALKLEPKETESLYLLARVALLEGDLREAEKQLKAALGAGLRPDEAARQMAWISSHAGDWKKAGDAFDAAGYPGIGARYRAFDGKPFAAKMGGNGCSTTAALIDNPQDVLVVEAALDGERVRLLVDTSTSDLIISDTRARSLVIGTDATAPLSAGGPPLAQGQLESLTIGDLEVKNVPVTMVSADQLAAVVALDGVDGVLGVRPFAGRQITIDQQTKVMELVEPGRKCQKQADAHRVGAAVPFWLHETHYIYVLGLMNGAEGVYLVNTGMRGADLAANDGAYAHAGVGAPVIQGGVPGLAKVEVFSLGDFQQKNIGAAWGFLQQNATSDMFRLDGMIGLRVLGGGLWTIDFEKRTLYLTGLRIGGTSAAPADEK
ncbi:MAG: clan AA aspartic protease [Myxococcales bacterium]|nr:clan AA aspartic protease [Myxococcales bacterium]